MCRLGHLHLNFACDIFFWHPSVHVCVVSAAFFFFFFSLFLVFCGVFCQSVASEMNAPGCMRGMPGELLGAPQFPVWNFSFIGLGFAGKFQYWEQ